MEYRIYIIIFILLSSQSLHSQDILLPLKKNGNWGAINIKNEVVIPFRYDKICNIPERNTVLFWIEDSCGLMDNKGEVLIHSAYDTIYYLTNDLVIGRINAKCTFYNLVRGEKLFNAQNKYVKYYNPIVLAGDGKTFRLIDLRTNEVFQSNIDSVLTGRYLSDNSFRYLITIKNKKFGLTTRNFHEIYQTRYDYIRFLTNKNLLIRQGIELSLADTTGHIFFKGNYENIRPYTNDLYQVTENKKNGIVTKDGKIILSPGFDNISISGNYFIVRKTPVMTTKAGAYDLNGRLICPVIYDDVTRLGNDYLMVKSRSKFGIINDKGKIIVPVVYSRISRLAGLFEVAGFNIEKNSCLVKKGLVRTINEAKKEPKYGIFNGLGDLIFDTLYFKTQISLNPEEKQILAETDTGTLVTVLNLQDRVIEKSMYKYFSKVNIRPYERNSWDQQIVDGRWKWGLLKSGSIVIDHQFNSYNDLYNNDSIFTLTSNLFGKSIVSTYIYSTKDQKWKEIRSAPILTVCGIVDRVRGVEVLTCSYVIINRRDFSINPLARIVNLRGIFKLMNRNFEAKQEGYNYIGDFQTGYARVNVGGKLKFKEENTFSLEVPGIEDFGMEQLLSKEYPLQCSGGKWGLIDSLGNLVIQPVYDFLQRTFDDKIIAVKNNKWGVIDKSQKVLVPFNFDEICFFGNVLNKEIWMDIPFYKAKIASKWGVIDLEGNPIIKFLYDDIQCLENVKGLFYAVKSGDYWGIVNSKNDTIVPVKFDRVSHLTDDHNELFKTEFLRTYYGYMNDSGKIILDARYRDAENFKNGFARVANLKGLWTFIRKDGKAISGYNFEKANDFSEGLAAINNKRKWGFIDTSGKVIIDQRFENVGNFHYGISAASIIIPRHFFGLIRSKKKFGYISRNGEFVIKPSYSDVFSSDGGVQRVIRKKKYALLDSVGNKIAGFKFIEISPFYGNIAIAKIKNKGDILIDKSGNRINDIFYSEIQPFQSGWAKVNYKNKWGFIDTLGNVKIPIEYLAAGDFSDSLARVFKNGKWSYIAKNGKPFEFNYSKVTDYQNGVARVTDLRDSVFHLNKFGEPLMDSSQIIKTLLKEKISFINKSTGKSYFDSLGKPLNRKIFADGTNFNKYGLAWVKMNGKWGMIYKNGKYYITPTISSINEESEGLRRYQFDYQVGVYSSEGEELYPALQLTVNKVNDNLFRIETLYGPGYIFIDKDRIYKQKVINLVILNSKNYY